ncbi:hypothetical protein KR200_001522, partial [Drosophila serrata]
SGLASEILSEHNYTLVRSNAKLSKHHLQELICFIHDRMSPGDTNELPSAELSRLLRHGGVLQRRLRLLLCSRKPHIEFEPMMPLQEAIAQELAKKLGCLTRFYKGWNESRYLVAYRPGVQPNSLEVRARRMCQKDEDPETVSVEEYHLDPMSFQDKIHKVQKTVSLGRKILEEFNRDYKPNRKRKRD